MEYGAAERMRGSGGRAVFQSYWLGSISVHGSTAADAGAASSGVSMWRKVFEVRFSGEVKSIWPELYFSVTNEIRK